MSELWCVRAGEIPYDAARALQKRLEAARQAGAIADVLLLLEHPAVYTKGRRYDGRRASDGRGLVPDAGHRRGRDRPRRTRHLPRARPARRLPDREPARPTATTSTTDIRRMERVMIDVARRPRRRGGPDRGTDRRLDLGASATAREDARRHAEARKIGSIGVHVNRGVTTHGFAINVNNDLQPFEWIVPCGIEACRMTSLTRELGAEQDMERLHGHGPRPLRRGSTSAIRSSSRRSSSRSASPGAARRRRYGRRMERGTLDERIHVTRSRRRPGGGPEVEGRPFRERKPPWLKVPAPGGPNYRRLQSLIARPGPQHRLPGGQLPQRRRVLGARHGDVHDPRRRLHPPLRLLQRPDGKAELQRPARADARRRHRQAHGPAPRGRSPRSTATTCPTTAPAPSSA